MDNPKAHDEIAAFVRFNVDIPESLFPPELHDIEEHLWDAFWNLSTDRSIGMGAGPIPWSSICRIESDWRAIGEKNFHKIIRAMDSKYLSHSKGENKPFNRAMFKGEAKA